MPLENKENKPVMRCPWCESADDYRLYHDKVWGVPEYNSQQLFAKLCLDGQQAGLSWITVLRKQTNYESAFFDFDPRKLAALLPQERTEFIEAQMQNSGIIRNRLKIESIFRNAEGYIAIEQQEQVSFSAFLWSFVGGKPLQNDWSTMAEVPSESEASRAMSKALKKRGFNFVGPTICYAFMQAAGMVNDHLASCFRHTEVLR